MAIRTRSIKSGTEPRSSATRLAREGAVGIDPHSNIVLRISARIALKVRTQDIARIVSGECEEEVCDGLRGDTIVAVV